MLQKARLARIHIAKNAAGNAFMNHKKKIEEQIIAHDNGMDLNVKEEDVFALQHHHLLSCLEKTTVST